MAKYVKPFAVKGFNVTSPKGTSVWCKITEPDRMFNDKGEFSTQLVCDPNDPAVKAFVKKLEDLRDTALAETKETKGAAGKGIKAKQVYFEEVDKDGEETGNIFFKFKLNNIDDRAANGDSAKILVFDAKKRVMDDVPLVGNGSVIRCVAYANPYFMANTKEVGISLIWSKMQLIDLVEFEGGGDEFDEEEGFEDDSPAFDEESGDDF